MFKRKTLNLSQRFTQWLQMSSKVILFLDEGAGDLEHSWNNKDKSLEWLLKQENKKNKNNGETKCIPKSFLVSYFNAWLLE